MYSSIKEPLHIIIYFYMKKLYFLISLTQTYMIILKFFFNQIIIKDSYKQTWFFCLPLSNSSSLASPYIIQKGSTLQPTGEINDLFFTIHVTVGVYFATYP